MVLIKSRLCFGYFYLEKQAAKRKACPMFGARSVNLFSVLPFLPLKSPGQITLLLINADETLDI